MPDKIRCQSCGMPLGEGFYGSNADGSENDDYCRFCYTGGSFAEPGLTLEGMIHKSVRHMIDELHLPEKQARESALRVIPGLKRWRKQKK